MLFLDLGVKSVCPSHECPQIYAGRIFDKKSKLLGLTQKKRVVFHHVARLHQL